MRRPPSCQAAHRTNKPSSHGINGTARSWRNGGQYGECASMPGCPALLGSRQTTDPAPPGALMPWCQCRPFANKTRWLAPWPDRGAGYQGRWEVEAPRFQGGYPGRPGLVGEVPTFQGHAVASGPWRHDDPDSLADGAPWYQAGRGPKVDDGAWHLGAACASIAQEPSPSMTLDRLSPGGPSRPIRHRRLGPTPPSAPWSCADQGGHGTDVPYIRMAPWQPRELRSLGTQVLCRSRCIERPGKPADWEPCHLRRPGATLTLGTRATRDRFGPGTKVIEGLEVPS
jgi:hypothetical protein